MVLYRRHHQHTPKVERATDSDVAALASFVVPFPFVTPNVLWRRISRGDIVYHVGQRSAQCKIKVHLLTPSLSIGTHAKGTLTSRSLLIFGKSLMIGHSLTNCSCSSRERGEEEEGGMWFICSTCVSLHVLLPTIC